MTLGTLKTSALAALAVTAISAPAMAAISYSNDDLFIGFREEGNTSFDYVINIGQASLYRDASGSFTLSGLTGLNADMTAAFGADWKTSNIFWGVVGTPGTSAVGIDGANLIYSSEPVGVTPTASTAQAGPRAQIVAMKNDYLTNTQGSVSKGAIGNPGDSTSWTSGIGTAFANGNAAPIEDSFNNNLDLFRLPNTSNQGLVTNEGFFHFDAANESITFNVPVPEPSTMLFGCAMIGALGLSRRRKAILA